MEIIQQYLKCILVLAISGLTVSVPVSQTTTVEVDSACKEIKCPPVSKPLCVELQFQPSALHTKSVYIELINRCEMKYITCYGGVATAKEIPMIYCDHGKNVTSDMHTLQVLPPAPKVKILRRNKKVTKKGTFPVKISKYLQEKNLRTNSKMQKSKTKIETPKAADVKKRVKRDTQTQEEEYLNKAKLALFDDTSVPLKKFKIKRVPNKYKIGSSYNGMKNQPRSHISLRMGNDVANIEETTHIIYGKGPEIGGKESDLEAEGILLVPGIKEESNLKNDDVTKYDEEKRSDDENKSDEENNSDSSNSKAENGPGQYVSGGDDEDIDPRALLIKEDAVLAAADTDREEYEIVSQENVVPEQANNTDPESECPKTCPARGVMLCGRCKDRIYRTFLSECHMRMFDCHHPDEKLELVSRLPCAMSGPYLDDLRVPEGVINEPGDDDVVLRYLRCKDYANSKLRPWSTINCNFE